MFGNFWNEKENQRQYMDWLGKELGFEKMEDWYKITHRNMLNNGGTGLLLEHYKRSPHLLIQSVYPEYNWLIWRFDCVERYWDNIEHHRIFMDWFSKHNNFKSMDDWYNVSQKDITNCGAYGLLIKYNNSVLKLVRSSFPKHEWIVWKFNSVPNGYWNNVTHQRKFLDWLGKQLGYQKMDDWYKITVEDIIQNAGLTISTKFNKSPNTMLQSIYPEHRWMIWRFETVPKGYWESDDFKREVTNFIGWLSNELQIKYKEEWYHISLEQLKAVISTDVFSKFSLGKMLQLVYPDHAWSISSLSPKPNTQISQTKLLTTIQQIFPSSG